MKRLGLLALVALSCVAQQNVRMGDFGADKISSPTLPFNVINYGAVCASGTDDTTAYQAAINAAHGSYASTGQIAKVQVCPVAQLGTGSGQTTINVGSGVLLSGPGSIKVPAQSTNPLFLLTSTDDDTIDGLNITFTTNLSGCASGVNNAACAVIRYDSAAPGTSAAHRNVTISNNRLINPGWGILIGPQAGTDSLSGIFIHDNFVGQSSACNSSASYQFNDGIHVGGAVSSFVIHDNIINCRGDAGIAVSSELLSGSTLLCHGGTVTGNVVYEGQVGFDNSGCDDLVITGNYAFADISTSNSNPAFRSIYYSNHLPVGVHVTGNTFQNYQSSPGVPDNSAKFDCGAGTGCGNGSGTVNEFFSDFESNVVETLYVKGSTVTLANNIFGYGGILTIDVDSANSNNSANIVIGPNNWARVGSIITNSNAAFYPSCFYSPQTGNPTWTNSAVCTPP